MSDEQANSYPPDSELNLYYLLVGRVAMGWAAFETRINHTIWRLAGVEQYAGACLTAQITAPVPRFKALVALAKFRGASEERCKALNSLSAAADGVARQRNRLVHDPAYTNDGKPFRLHITADRAIDFEMKPVELQDFQKLELEISRITNRCIQEISLLFSEIPPYDDKSFWQGEGIELGPMPERGDST
ncbi:hypothetical protein SAMN05877838_2378 [Hoeflea halophila]|uniref:Uncharacterized protein n=1 Tax=Hoeflea halophila TaxID=714899 RepID=A0A286IBH3_9HYPH|nr:hypothetical protein [Hoeflea halophila]SOE17478.1 hypothetical protein SAMN05877838_2378 [Hoeflea halophila]